MFGIRPDKEFLPRSRISSLEALVMELGIVPISLFSNKLKNCMFGIEWPIVDGRWPESLFVTREMAVMLEILKTVGGMGPLKLLLSRIRYFRFFRLPISFGISPAIMQS